MVCMDLELVFSACLVLLYVVTFIEDIYNYIPETNRVSMVYSIAAALYLQFLLNVMLCSRDEIHEKNSRIHLD